MYLLFLFGKILNQHLILIQAQMKWLFLLEDTIEHATLDSEC